MNRRPKFLQSKSKSHSVSHVHGYTYQVESGTSGNTYTVRLSPDLQKAWCTCDWAKYRPHNTGHVCGCSHTVAVYRYLAAETDATISVWSSEDDARRQHRPWWPVGDGLFVTQRRAAAPAA
jgi:hypothetical protein